MSLLWPYRSKLDWNRLGPHRAEPCYTLTEPFHTRLQKLWGSEWGWWWWGMGGEESHWSKNGQSERAMLWRTEMRSQSTSGFDAWKPETLVILSVSITLRCTALWMLSCMCVYKRVYVRLLWVCVSSCFYVCMCVLFLFRWIRTSACPSSSVQCRGSSQK